MNLHNQLFPYRCSYRLALHPEAKCLISLSTASPTNQGQRKGSSKGSDAPLPGALSTAHLAVPAPMGPRNVLSSTSLFMPSVASHLCLHSSVWEGRGPECWWVLVWRAGCCWGWKPPENGRVVGLAVLRVQLPGTE